MTATVFTKTYPTQDKCALALGNYACLQGYATPLILPTIRAAGPGRIEFDYIKGRHAIVADLPGLAAHLGDAHGAAWSKQLRHARLDQPHTTPSGHRLADFITPRKSTIPLQTLSALTHGPTAFYKDANLRNTLVTDLGEFMTIDFDDLTLAPFGYDLAKLVVSLAMTHGPLPIEDLRTAVHRYNAAAARHERVLGYTTMAAFLDMADIHGQLTAAYLDRNDYAHRWQRPDLLLTKGQS